MTLLFLLRHRGLKFTLQTFSEISLLPWPLAIQIAEDICWPRGFISGKLVAHFLHHLRNVAPLRIPHTHLWLQIGSADVFSLFSCAVSLAETFIYVLKNEILT